MPKKNATENPFEPESNRRDKKSAGRKPRRWPWVFMLLLIVGILFLPNIVAKTPLKQTAIDFALADFKGKVSVENLDLSWFSPIEVSGISAVDEQGQTMLQVTKVTTSKPLYSFLSGSEYGELVIDQPTIHLHLRPDGSNLEDAIAKMISPKDEQANQPAKLPQLRVKCNHGIVYVSSSATNEQWTIDSLDAVANVSLDNTPLAVEAQCQFSSDGNPFGGLATNCQIDAGASELTFAAAQLAINAQNVPLSLAAPIMQRFVGPASIAGYMTGELQMAYDSSSNQFAVSTQQLNMTGVGLAASELIGQDNIYAENLNLQGQINISPKQISASQFKLDSELAELTADGTFNANQLAGLVSEGELLTTPFHMEGSVDLARVATMLPNSLQLHSDLKIQSGIISFQATSKQKLESEGQGSRRMVVNIDTANIRARRGNQDIIWQKPLRLAGTVNQSNGQFALENVRIQSDFLEVEGNGSLESGEFMARGDLAQLVNRVEQFADLGGAELAGNLNGRFGWQIAQTDSEKSLSLQNRPIQINGRFDIADPTIKWPELPRWQPNQLSIRLQGTGIANAENAVRLNEGGFQLLIGTEQLTATLSEPVVNVWNNAAWKFNSHMTGEWAGWIGHAKNFADLGDISGAGQVDLTCVATIDSQRLLLGQMNYSINKFEFDGYGVTIREPRLDGKGSLKYELANGQTTMTEFSAQGRSIVADSNQLVLSFAPNVQLHGDVAFQADVNRIADWYGLSPRPDDIRWYGTAQGIASFNSNTNGIGGHVQAKINDLVAAQPVATARNPGSVTQLAGNQMQLSEIWREALVNLDSTLAFSNDFNFVRFQNLKVDSSSLRLNAHGSISQLMTLMVADLEGTWNPNWKMVNALLDAYSGKMVRFTGTGAQAFSIKGPILPPVGSQNAAWVHPQLQVNTSIAWDAANIFRFPLSANKVSVNLNQGVANLAIQEIPLSGGRLTIAPQLDLRTENPLLLINQGLLADRVQLTPETCRQWLKYVAPWVADATSAQGTFSVNSGGVRMPLMDPMSVNAQGTVRLSNISIGAGPLAEQLLGTANQLRSLLKPGEARAMNNSAWLTMVEQDVPIAIQNQRVYHENITFNYKDIQFRTRGSVGIDQSINMVAEIPFQEDWLVGNKWLQGLKGQSLSIPVSGTVMKPRLDQRAVQQFSQQLVRQAAGSALNSVVEEKLGGSPQDVINNRLTEEVGKAQNKINDKIQQEVGDKLEKELFNGLNNLFKKDKQPQ